MKRNTLLLIGVILAGVLAMAAQQYDFKVFTYEEVNHLRQASPLKRMDILRDVVERYSQSVGRAVRMRNYDRMGRTVENMNKLMDYVRDDIGICVDNPDFRNKKELRKFEITLRKSIYQLKGIQRAVPYRFRDQFDPVIRELTFSRRVLFRFINNLDKDKRP